MKDFWQLTHEERVELYNKDPKAFEDLYMKEAKKLGIKGEQILWVEQNKLRKYKNPQMRMTMAARSMMDSFTKLREELGRLKDDYNSF